MGKLATRFESVDLYTLRGVETHNLQGHCVGGDKEPARSTVRDKENATLSIVQVVRSATRQTKRTLLVSGRYTREAKQGRPEVCLARVRWLRGRVTSDGHQHSFPAGKA